MEEKRILPDDVLELLIIKGIMKNEHYLTSLLSVWDPNYFNNEKIKDVYNIIINYFKKYNKLLENKYILEKHFEEDEEILDILKEMEGVDYDVTKNFQHLFDETNRYLKEQALKELIRTGVGIIDKNEDPLVFKEYVNEALSKDLIVNLGVNYWDDLSPRLKRILQGDQERVPSFFPTLDDLVAGGFPPYSLSVIMARIHGCKTNCLINMASRQALQGHNPIILTLEMSEDAVCQRLDSINTCLDINRIYISKETKYNMISSLQKIKTETEGIRGKLIVKEFPTGNADIDDFRSYLRELQYRGIKPGPIFCDYLQLMKAKYKKDQKRHDDIKTISEGLRALSLEWRTPVISVSQLNREGMFTGFDDIDFTYVAEGIGISATADFISILGRSDDDLVYESEVHYKIVKNRLGGRVGEIGKFFLDSRSLKMYDGETELDQWVEDVKKSGDKIKMKERS